jgi:hypothetical protein
VARAARADVAAAQGRADAGEAAARRERAAHEATQSKVAGIVAKFSAALGALTAHTEGVCAAVAGAKRGQGSRSAAQKAALGAARLAAAAAEARADAQAAAAEEWRRKASTFQDSLEAAEARTAVMDRAYETLKDQCAAAAAGAAAAEARAAASSAEVQRQRAERDAAEAKAAEAKQSAFAAVATMAVMGRRFRAATNSVVGDRRARNASHRAALAAARQEADLARAEASAAKAEAAAARSAAAAASALPSSWLEGRRLERACSAGSRRLARSSTSSSGSSGGGVPGTPAALNGGASRRSSIYECRSGGGSSICSGPGGSLGAGPAPALSALSGGDRAPQRAPQQAAAGPHWPAQAKGCKVGGACGRIGSAIRRCFGGQ